MSVNVPTETVFASPTPGKVRPAIARWYLAVISRDDLSAVRAASKAVVNAASHARVTACQIGHNAAPNTLKPWH